MPDIVFMDIRMPEMSGTDATRHLIGQYGPDRIKIVAITASVLEHQRDAQMAAGFHGFLGKPFHFADVCDCLRNLLGIEFEYGELRGGVRTGISAEDWEPAALPESVIRDLQEAAECFNATRLDQCVNALEAVGGDGTRVAERLRPLIRTSDFESVIQLLREMKNLDEPPREAG